ncbi:hypothetical protein [Salinigranum marinum]|uniref:hypothetical protein n=1 Tax=Salinigranum marinum TaxID=1515595 RepID=UPI002989BEF2|nr:hypothetical protein [Salinigranum marinum]
MVSLRDDDAGQLILVGSIALAFVVVTLAVAFNGVLFADSLADSEARADLDVAEGFDRAAAGEVPRLLLYVNHRRPYADQAALDAAVRANVSTYARLHAESRLRERPGVVNVSLHDWADGTRVLQSTDGAFTADGSAGGATDWEPVDTSRRVGWAVLNLDAANVSDATGSDRARVVLDDGTDTSVLYLSRNTTTGADSETVDVETALSSGNGTAAQPCTPSRGRLLLDLRRGTAFGGDCSFNLTEPLDDTYDIRIENGENATGKYAFVTEGSPPNGLSSCPVGTGPCNAPVVWEATITTTSETGETTANTTRTVAVYP